jgi:hypothetical protein
MPLPHRRAAITCLIRWAIWRPMGGDFLFDCCQNPKMKMTHKRHLLFRMLRIREGQPEPVACRGLLDLQHLKNFQRSRHCGDNLHGRQFTFASPEG